MIYQTMKRHGGILMHLMLSERSQPKKGYVVVLSRLVMSDSL